MTPVSGRPSPVASHGLLLWSAVSKSRVSGLLLGLMLAAPAVAQQDTISRTLIRKSEALTFLGFGLAAVAISPADERLAAWIRGPLAQGRSGDFAAGAFNLAGDPGTVLWSAGLYLYGLVTDRRHAMDAGLHIGESIVVATVITDVLKLSVGRARPFVSADTNSHDFQFGRGIDGGQFQSLPSGHATAAFALASALSSEAAAWKPHWRWVAPTAYGTATFVGLARMYDDKHWASDVVLGAGIGIAAAKATVRFNHARPNNRVDRALIGGDARSSFRLTGWRSADGRTHVGLARDW